MKINIGIYLPWIVAAILILGTLIHYVLVLNGVGQPLIKAFYRNHTRKFIYLGDGHYYLNQDIIKRINFLRRQGLFEDAALEFSAVTNLELEDGKKAMKAWDEITGEGIIRKGKVVYTF